MIREHLWGIVNAILHRATNGPAEGINGLPRYGLRMPALAGDDKLTGRVVGRRHSRSQSVSCSSILGWAGGGASKTTTSASGNRGWISWGSITGRSVAPPVSAGGSRSLPVRNLQGLPLAGSRRV